MSEVHAPRADGRALRDRAQKVGIAVAIVFLLIGLLGFVPGVTTNYSEMSFASHDSAAMLFGLFQVSILHNAVHLLYGLVGLAMSRTGRGARAFLLGGGIIYLVLFIYGLVVPQETAANFVPLNNADDWLHLVLGVGMIALALLVRDRVAPHRAMTTP